MAFTDPGQDNVQGFAQEARQETSSGQANNYMGGSEPARGLLNTPSNYSSNLGMASDPTRDAIHKKFSGGYTSAHAQLSIDSLKNADQDHLKKLEVATQMAGQEHAMNLQKEILRKKMSQARAMARGQLLGSVLGIVGGVVGAVYGGAPGAMAGSAAGEGVGNAIGRGGE